MEVLRLPMGLSRPLTPHCNSATAKRPKLRIIEKSQNMIKLLRTLHAGLKHPFAHLIGSQGEKFRDR